MGNDHDNGALAPTSQPERRELLIAPTTALGSLRREGQHKSESGTARVRNGQIVRAQALKFDDSAPKTHVFSTISCER